MLVDSNLGGNIASSY